MKTEFIELCEENENNENYQQTIKKAGDFIRNGGLVAFPTETVYGLGGDAKNPMSSSKIYEAKGRPSDNPLIVHIAEMKDVEEIAKGIPDTARILMEKFWPGPLTMVFQKKDCVPKETTGGLETVAVRMPSHPIALDFIREAGGFVAAPSANRSGKPSPTKAKYVKEDMDGRIDLILSSDTIDIGLESTIVDFTSEQIVILRPGFITREMIEEVLNSQDIQQVVLGQETFGVPKAPGMKYRHYAPKGELIIIEGPMEQVQARINELSCEAKKAGHKTGVLASEDCKDQYRADVIKSVGAKDRPMEIAKNLYLVLREFDDEGVTKIYSEAFQSKGLGQALMNRLLKAAGNHVYTYDEVILEEE